MKSTEASWHISLDCHCPYCNDYQDIQRENAEQDFLVEFGERREFKTEENEEGFSLTCQKCKKEFCISKTEY